MRKREQDQNDFMECEICRNKPGSPSLCEACLHNRDLVSRLQWIIKSSSVRERALNKLTAEERKVLGV